jgi:hypothetical protein
MYPDCHAMLHLSRDTMHPDTLKEIIYNRNQEGKFMSRNISTIIFLA